jgi:gamma-glutamylcyclotransferase (GGCT)/AIG2-like uncharacterized protein YtfP
VNTNHQLTTPSAPILYSTVLPIFVYGTLRSGEYNWQRYLKGRTQREQPAVAPRHVLYANEFPYVVDGEGSVLGDLMTIGPELYAEVLRDIDGLEEFDPASATGWYLRVARVVLVNAVPTMAWIYHASPSVMATILHDHRIPGGDWVSFRA